MKMGFKKSNQLYNVMYILSVITTPAVSTLSRIHHSPHERQSIALKTFSLNIIL